MDGTGFFVQGTLFGCGAQKELLGTTDVGFSLSSASHFWVADLEQLLVWGSWSNK